MDDAEYYGRERQLYGDGTVELFSVLVFNNQRRN